MKSDVVYKMIGKLGGLYDFGFTITGYQKSIRYFVQMLNTEANESLKSVLDAGCGTGQYACALLEQRPSAHLVAFDLEPEMVNRTRRLITHAGYANRATFFTGDITGPLTELTNQQFDAIMISGVLEYTDPASTVQNITRFLRPGGWLLHSPVRDTAWTRAVGKLYRFTPYARDEIVRPFTSQGFELRQVVQQLPFLLPPFKEAHIFRKVQS